MNDKRIFDTSILVYAFDNSEEKKHRACKDLVAKVFGGESKGTVTNQILSELFYVLITKIARPLSKPEACAIVDDFILSNNWEKINYTSNTLRKAMLASQLHGAHFWDALIAETALENNVTAIITENRKDFDKLPLLKIINPLKSG